MADSHEPDSAIEQALLLGAQLHALAQGQQRLEQITLAIHRATCPVLACTHTYADVDPADVQRAQYVINTLDRDQADPP